MNKLKIGHRAEKIAKQYLIDKGWRFLNQNTYNKYGEIDLIFVDGDYIVFVEVKSVSKKSGISIYETLLKRKLARLNKAIQQWLTENNQNSELWRLDFVGIIFSNQSYKLEHFENIQFPTNQEGQ